MKFVEIRTIMNTKWWEVEKSKCISGLLDEWQEVHRLR